MHSSKVLDAHEVDIPNAESAVDTEALESFAGAGKLECPLCCLSFQSAWKALGHVCLAAATCPQQQWTPAERTVVVEGTSLDSEGCSESATDEDSMFSSSSFGCFELATLIGFYFE